MDIQVGSVPFNEAIDFLRSKVDIPTGRWDEMLGEAHAKGFTVAGATKVDLLGDLHSLVNDALANGTTITDFRKGFDDAVQKHGWTYKGKRGWRTRVIFDNNMRTARAAGRWQQFQRVKEKRPYLVYMTVGDSRVRPEHRVWRAVALPVDHPWWDTHFPPNGWGCRCYVINASLADLERMGIEVDEAPPLDLTERINAATGEIYGDVPKGIDVGWNYNVGKAWLGPDIALGEKVISSQLTRQAATTTASLAPLLQKDYAKWVDRIIDRKRPIGEMKAVGYLSETVINALDRRQQKPTTALITVTDKEVMHMLREAKKEKALPVATVKNLPNSLQSPKAVLWDKRDPAILYVFDVLEEERLGKFVVRINYKTTARAKDGGRESIKTNRVRTGGLVPLLNLKDKSVYEVIEGQL